MILSKSCMSLKVFKEIENHSSSKNIIYMFINIWMWKIIDDFFLIFKLTLKKSYINVLIMLL